MQKAILNRLRYFKPIAQISRMEQTDASKPRIPFELNEVNMTGTIEHEIYTSPKTNITCFYLKTRNADGTYLVHKTNIVNKKLLAKIGPNTLGLNQAIYVGGRLKSSIEEIEGRNTHTSEVYANELYFLDSNQRSMEELNLSSSFDQNRVRLLSRISSNPSRTEKNISFSIVTHYDSVKNPGSRRDNCDYHRIVVERKNNLFLTARLLERGDRVFVEGFLNYGIYTDRNTGTEQVISFITPSVIVKFKKNVRRAEEILKENV